MRNMCNRNAVMAYLALGANLGDAQQAVRQAMQDIAQLPETRLLACSSLYRTAPVDADGPDYINAVLEVQTGLSPLELLHHCQLQEQAAGRQRPYRNAPRTLDMDLVLYADQRVDLPELSVPHPRMWQRAFVLLPLAEIAPEKVSRQQLQAVLEQRIERLAAAHADEPQDGRA